MDTKLSNLANILSGYSFRGSVPSDQHGEYKVVQVKDIDSNGEINFHSLTPVDASSIKTDAFLQTGDILLSTRGTESSGLKVGIYHGIEQNIIATSSFYILRIKDKEIFSKYLLYYLNSFCGQRSLKSLMSGATVQTISKKDLSDLRIPIPPTEKQKIIVDTMTNIIQQKILLKKKIQLLNTLTDNIISIHQ